MTLNEVYLFRMLVLIGFTTLMAGNRSKCIPCRIYRTLCKCLGLAVRAY